MSQPQLISGKHPLVLGEVGHKSLINFKFVLSAPWSACRICGSVYQSDLDRLAYELMMNNDPDYLPTYEESKRLRDDWRTKHERAFHTSREIARLNESGNAVTAEAANNLAPYGIIPIGDVVLLDEIDQALLEAPRAPLNDAEGT